jgi:hypothetical protein
MDENALHRIVLQKLGRAIPSEVVCPLGATAPHVGHGRSGVNGPFPCGRVLIVPVEKIADDRGTRHREEDHEVVIRGPLCHIVLVKKKKKDIPATGD